MANIEITSNPEFVARNLAISPEACDKANKSGTALAILNNHEISHDNTKNYESDLDR